jgi:Ca2+-binding EF-hand superfamily protein
MGADELHVVLLAIGRVMSLDDVTTIIVDVKSKDELGNHRGGVIDEDHAEELNFNEFIRLMSKEMLDTDVTEELVEAFKEFGPQSD